MTRKINISTSINGSFRSVFAGFLIAAAALYGLAATPADATPRHTSRPAARANVPMPHQQIRQALSLAIDRRAIEDHVASGDADRMAQEAFATMLAGNVFQNEFEELAKIAGEFDEFGATFVDTPYGFEPFPEPFEDRRIRITGATGVFGRPMFFEPLDSR